MNLLPSQCGYGSANQTFALVLECCWRWTMTFSGSVLTKQIHIRKMFPWSVSELCRKYKPSCPANLAERNTKVTFDTFRFICSFQKFKVCCGIFMSFLYIFIHYVGLSPDAVMPTSEYSFCWSLGVVFGCFLFLASAYFWLG